MQSEHIRLPSKANGRRNIMALPGVSTVGITFGYGVETTAGEKPATFTQLTRINTIAGLDITNENIDASALEDTLTKYIKGRGDIGGGEWSYTLNLTPETVTETETMMTAAATAYAAGKSTWYEIIIPGFTQAIFVVAQPGSEIPVPEMNQNELLTVDIPLTVNDYKGFDTKVNFT